MKDTNGWVLSIPKDTYILDRQLPTRCLDSCFEQGVCVSVCVCVTVQLAVSWGQVQERQMANNKSIGAQNCEESHSNLLAHGFSPNYTFVSVIATAQLVWNLGFEVANLQKTQLCMKFLVDSLQSPSSSVLGRSTLPKHPGFDVLWNWKVHDESIASKTVP